MTWRGFPPPTKTFLNDFTHWSNSEFEAAKNGSNFALMVNSWIEQRSFITNALRALSSSGTRVGFVRAGNVNNTLAHDSDIQKNNLVARRQV
jgi:hypothetical protein